MFKRLLCMLGVHDGRVMWYEFTPLTKALVVQYECRCCDKLYTNRR